MMNSKEWRRLNCDVPGDVLQDAETLADKVREMIIGAYRRGRQEVRTAAIAGVTSALRDAGLAEEPPVTDWSPRNNVDSRHVHAGFARCTKGRVSQEQTKSLGKQGD